MNILKKNVKNALEFTDEIVTNYPGRLTGTDSAKKSAQRLYDEFLSYCDRTYKQLFTHRPDGFLRFIKFAIPFYIIAALIAYFYPKYTFISFGFLALAVVMFLSQFVFYYDWFDFLAPEEEGANVYGIIEPEGEVKQQIIISGHYDAPYVFTWVEKFRSILYSPLLIIIIVLILVSSIFTGIAGYHNLFGGSYSSYLFYVPTVMLIGIIFALPLFWFHTNKISPAAGDNMIAVAMASEIGKIVRDAKDKGKGLQNTRLMVMAFDAEEAGLNGARAFCKAKESDLHLVKTYVYNIDSIYSADYLTFFTRDINGVVPLSKKMVADAQKAAEEEGYKTKAMPIPFGGGATDSGEFGRIGVESTCLLAMPTNALRMDLAYHTERDTVDAIDEEAVEACLKVALRYIKNKDIEVAEK